MNGLHNKVLLKGMGHTAGLYDFLKISKRLDFRSVSGCAKKNRRREPSTSQRLLAL